MKDRFINASDTLAVPLQTLIDLAIEQWRLARSLGLMPEGGPAAARHAARRIGDVLRKLGLETHELDGQPFFAGLAATVVDVIEDSALKSGQVVVMETLSPQVLLGGRVVRNAEVVTASGARAVDDAP